MEILVTRNWTKPAYTIGRLFVGGRLMANTLELPNGSGQGKPRCGERIAAGRYVISRRYSPSQRRECLWVTIPGDKAFNERYILIHAGNSVKDTAGCLLVGWNAAVGWLSDSRKTLEAIEAVVIPAIKRGEKVNLTVRS